MHRRFFHSKLQGEDEQIGYSCVIYEDREGPLFPFHLMFQENLLIISDKLLVPY